MSEQRMKMLRRYRVRFQEIVASREDIGMKRARSDGQITMLLAELVLLLPVDERELIQEVIRLHNALWEISPTALAQLVHQPGEMGQDRERGADELQALREAYSSGVTQFADRPGVQAGYEQVARVLKYYNSIPAVVEALRRILAREQRSFPFALGTDREELREKLNVIEAFLSRVERCRK